MKRKVDFDWYCKIKKDVINNAAYELIVALTAKSAPPRKFELSIPQWDDLMIANIVENAINAIDERIGYYCHPFYHEVDKLPCYLGDRCDNPHCIFKSDPDYRKAPSSVMDMDIEERGEDMHSRIIELSKDPILKHERMCESSVPDWFYHSIADYTDADTDRDTTSSGSSMLWPELWMWRRMVRASHLSRKPSRSTSKDSTMHSWIRPVS